MIAAAYMCQALGLRISRRNLNTVIERQVGQGFTPDFILGVMRRFTAERNGSSEPLPEHENAISGTTLPDPQMALLPDAEPSSKAKRTRRIPSPADLAAYAILTAAYPVVFGTHSLGMTRQAWMQRNKAAALDLHRLGKKPPEVVAMLQAAYADPFANGIIMLGRLQELWPKIESRMGQGKTVATAAVALEDLDEQLRNLK